MIKRLLLKILLWGQTRFLYRFRHVGEGCRLDRSLFVYPHRVSLGKRCYIGRYSYLDGDITIGDNTLLASSVAIVGGDHAYDQPGTLIIDGGREHWKPTTIGADVWIGHGAVLLNGITVGDGAVIAAGSIVTKDVPPYTIVAGNPARPLRPRFNTLPN